MSYPLGQRSCWLLVIRCQRGRIDRAADSWFHARKPRIRVETANNHQRGMSLKIMICISHVTFSLQVVMLIGSFLLLVSKILIAVKKRS